MTLPAGTKNIKALLLGIIICGLLIISAVPPAAAYYYSPADSEGEATAVMILDDQLQRQLNKFNLGEIDIFLKQLDQEAGQYIPQFDLQGILTNIRQGELPLNPAAIGRGLAKYLFHELLASSALLGQLLILAIACAVLQNLQAAFSESAIAVLARSVVFLALISLALTSFTLAIRIGSEAVERMVSFCQSLLPLLITMLAASGAITTSSLLQPVFIYAISIIGNLMRDFLFPLLYLAAVLTVISQITDRFQISKMAGMLKQISLWVLGLTLTVFAGVLSIYGAAGSVADGVGLRALEFAAGSFLPIVGSMLTDAVGTVAGATLLLKSAVSLIGVIIIFFLAAFPMLKILSIVAVYKVAAALVQPFGEEQLADSLEGISGALLLVFACVATAGLIFFMAVVMIVILGNLTLALRG